MLPALREGYINVDEMRFEDLLAMASEHAGLLKYIDLSNEPAGDWRGFFDRDEACILASILAFKLDLAEAGFSMFMTEWGTAIANLRSGRAKPDILPGFKLAARIDSWYLKLGGMSSVAAVRAREKIADVIEKTLGYELHRLLIFMRQCEAPGADDAFKGFSPVWRDRATHPDHAAPSADYMPEQLLKSNFHAFCNAIRFLQGCAEELLSKSLGRDDHDPAMGLLMTFLKLFSKAQGRLNEFTGKHLDFYYERILKIQRRDFVPDSAYLIFYPDTAGREVVVKSGTEFTAGLDGNNSELIYAADNDLLVNDARVFSLHTLHIGRNRLSFPENSLPAPLADDGEERKFATSAKLNRIAVTGGKGSAPADGKVAWPLFGVPPRSRENQSFEEARLGFAVASNVLLMKHGRRDITLTFKLATVPGAEEEGPLDMFIGRLSGPLSASRPDAPPATFSDAFFKAFRRMFTISLTGEKGWIEVAEYLPLHRALGDGIAEPDCFKIQIRLPDSAGAVVPYVPAIHGERFDTSLPVIKFAVNPDAYLYPYSLLRDLAVGEILIEVEVTGCTDVKIYNQLGPLSASAQFQPFGPLPAVGDYLVVGNYEVAQKNLTAFDVDVEWGNLPHEMNGFEEYYRAYSLRVENSAFKASLSVLRDRKWLPADGKDGQEADLFASGGARSGNHTVERRRTISFQGLCKFLSPIDGIPEEKYAYDAQAKDGFFRLALSNPENAFGHKIYPMVMSNVMIENAKQNKFWLFKLFSRAVPPKALPNPPYTPLINAISINYKAVSSINLGRVTSADESRLKEKIFHLHPLGLEALSPRVSGKICLVPRYEADGNLFVGLTASKLSGLLTLFFHLREDSLPEAGAREFNFTWHYLSSNKWKQLSKSQVVSDTTNGFLTSGIVTLDIPADINRENTVLPGDQYWIRVSANNIHMHSLCSLYDVHAQALKTTWVRQPGNGLSHLGKRLAAGAISEAKRTIPGIAGIRQIMDSLGGRAVESDDQRTVRVSERLKHKNRAITPWDYEKLILQEFPEIYKVNCLPCMADDDDLWEQRKPGNLLIVVIPHLKEDAYVNMEPKVDAMLLRKVRNYVRALAPSFVGITVRNPDYEQIQIRCKVKFRPGKGQGFYYNELNSEIVNFISPWHPSGIGASFDWRIRCHDVQSHIQGLGYVESVSGLSMLRVTATRRNTYRLSDTVRDWARKVETGGITGDITGDIEAADARVDQVESAHPWSIAVPFARHLIEVVGESGVYPSEETGIGKLAIGSTFIVSRGYQ